MTDFKITECSAREIINSHAVPTVEAQISTSAGTAKASVPSGTPRDPYEAAELRDGLRGKYHGMGVETAVSNINTQIADAITGMNVFDQRGIDKTLCRLDGSVNKGRLGANALLAVSLACAKAAAKAASIPFYRYIGGCNPHIMPMPLMNIINGNNNIKEFMIVPVKASCLRAALRMSAEICYEIKSLLTENGHSAAVSDNGAFSPILDSDSTALELICTAVKNAGYQPGSDFKLALAADASEWYRLDGTYKLPASDTILTKHQLADYWENISSKYPVISIEDPAAKNDFEAWHILTNKLGGKTQLTGNELFVTNIYKFKKARNIANSMLIKINQAGTLTETLDMIYAAQINGYNTILSHRSGETEDTSIADIAVAVNAGQIKTGSLYRSEHTAKYNRLLCIEEETGGKYIGEKIIEKNFANIPKFS